MSEISLHWRPVQDDEQEAEDDIPDTVVKGEEVVEGEVVVEEGVEQESFSWLSNVKDMKEDRAAATPQVWITWTVKGFKSPQYDEGTGTFGLIFNGVPVVAKDKMSSS